MRKLILFGTLIGWVMMIQAQTESVNLQEEQAIMKVVEDIFKGMAAGDSDAVRSGFLPKPVFYSVFQRKGEGPQLHTDPEGFEQWLESIGTPHPEPYNEVLYDSEVRIDGDLAMVWTKYALFVGETFHHCGVDLMQLVRDEAGQWKVFQVTDTKRREGGEIPDHVKP